MASVSFGLMRFVLLAFALLCACPVAAGPPYDTDDPEPTDTGQWELYLATSLDGLGDLYEGEEGLEVNYGPARDVQVGISTPVAFSHNPSTEAGLGDIELSAKYRFFNDEASGLQLAVFPAFTLPTGNNGFSAGQVTGHLPVWAQWGKGKWSVFGGGGYQYNPGAGNRDFGYGGIAVTRDMTERLAIGFEATREGPTAIGDRATTGLGAGMKWRLKAPLSLLLRGGPSFEDGGGPADYHIYLALGLDF